MRRLPIEPAALEAAVVKLERRVVDALRRGAYTYTVGPEREAGLLQGAEVAPDRPDGAPKLTGGVVGHHTLGTVDHREDSWSPRDIGPAILMIR